MEQRLRASPEQFQALIEFMERNGDLARPQPGSQGRLRSDRMWQQLAALLNSIGGGVDKTVEKWKKVWADWKTKTKRKYLSIRTHASGTGGGPSSRLTLTALEERVVAMLGASAVMGQAGVEEQGLDRPSTSQNSHNEHEELNDPIFDFPESLPPPPATPRFDVFPPSIMPMPDTMPSPPSPPPPSPPPPLSQESSPPLAPPPPPPPRRPRARPQARPSQPSPAPPHTPPPGPSRRRRASASPRSTATTPRRLLQRARRNRGETPFDRATAAFVAVENRRLQLEEAREQRVLRLEEARLRQEEARERREHELALERLRLEAERIAAERERNGLLRHLGEVVERALQVQGHNATLPSTDPI